MTQKKSAPVINNEISPMGIEISTEISTEMNENFNRWTVKRKMPVVLDIIEGKTTTTEASRSFDLSPSEVQA